MVRQAFAADLLGTPAFAHGVDQLNPIRVDDPEHRRGSQEGLRPVLRRHEEAKEPGPLRSLGKQRAIVSRQPAIKGAVAYPLERVERPQGNHLTGPEAGIGVFGHGVHLLIDLVE